MTRHSIIQGGDQHDRLYLSSDGKHTVHVSEETPEKMMKLLPHAKLLYEAIVGAYGTKAQMWEKRGNGEAKGNGHANGNGDGQKDGHAERKAPLCPVHKTPMAYREGRFGAFWSCPTRTSDRSWCSCTMEPDGQLRTRTVPA